jgi:hypothetical protein
MTPNSFTPFLALTNVLQQQNLLETRITNNASGQPLYVGWNLTPNASVSSPTWYIVKMSYDTNGFLDRVQLPDLGPGFFFEWSIQSTYFS